MKAARQIHVRISRLVVDAAASGAVSRTDFAQQLQSAITAELAGRTDQLAVVANPAAGVAAAIAAQLPPQAKTSIAGGGYHGRR